ncbi:hypothetical protein CMI37_13565 [Candidatus Pacearchaeota archaeon]|nr:hypothetical protein [Candidatus Pacearchaeota archaeon]
MKDVKLTSVNILENLYNHFKVTVVNSNMTLQKLTNRSVFLYLNDKEFRDRLDTTDDLTISASRF